MYVVPHSYPNLTEEDKLAVLSCFELEYVGEDEDLKNMIQPIYKALYTAKYKNFVDSVVTQYLGENKKISQTTNEDKDSLQYIYDKLLDFAEEKNVDWEES